jgi:hypothetical protein
MKHWVPQGAIKSYGNEIYRDGVRWWSFSSAVKGGGRNSDVFNSLSGMRRSLRTPHFRTIWLPDWARSHHYPGSGIRLRLDETSRWKSRPTKAKRNAEQYTYPSTLTLSWTLKMSFGCCRNAYVIFHTSWKGPSEKLSERSLLTTKFTQHTTAHWQ